LTRPTRGARGGRRALGRVALISLGCAKNLVDSEVMLGVLKKSGYPLAGRAEDADIVIVNTCGFIGPAREEAEETLREVLRLKRRDARKKIIAAGCYVERDRTFLERKFPDFLAADKLAAYVRDAHAKGAKVKIYYTLRELTNHIAELWAVRSLGHEVFADGPGGGCSWLHEHLRTGYVRAWHHWFPDGDVDAALVTSGLSRWHNYYLEGLAWLLRHVEIDGLYLDDVGYDREVMKRVRKILDRTRPGCLVDFHSWNHFNAMAGFANCANLYLELFPYVDSLWFGEGFDYNESPDYWLVEIAGIPFGLMGEMLQGGGNPWRGMVYGMTARMPWAGNPSAIWKLWDDFGIREARMLGYWVPDCPVKTDNKDVLATVYARAGRALVAVASWAKGEARCRLEIDWEGLDLRPEKARLVAPAIEGFQPQMTLKPTDEITVPPGRGYLLIIDHP